MCAPRRPPLWITLLVVLLLAPPAPAMNGNLLISFNDYLGPTCTTATCQNPVLRFYVCALLMGASESGITGAEYKLQFGSGGPDTGWMIQETAVPDATVMIGRALDLSGVSSGVDLAWPTCQTGDGHLVVLEVYDAYYLDCQSARRYDLQVVKHDHASNQYFQCPLLVLCDAPVYTKVCVGTVRVCQNPEPPFANNAMCSTGQQAWINYCPIAVEPTSWSAVKSIYR
jgi:hypothetical protein